MAEARTYNCPSCGGPLPIEHRFVRMVACRYCGMTSEVQRDSLAPAGFAAKLVNLPTRFRVGQIGKIRTMGFKVLGRVRYAYDESVWDEWYLAFDDGSAGWLEEEEGEYTLSRAEALLSPPPTFDEARLGTRFVLNDHHFTVVERCRARVAGAEGQLFFRAVPNLAVNFVDGNIGGRTAYLEYGADGSVEFGVGDPLPMEDVELAN